MQVSVSVIIPIKNEARNLPRCLASVKWADEIWVVDSHSADESLAIAEAAGAKVVQFDFNGIWPKKKNWALDNLPFRNEWVFILDADEVLPPETEDEIRAIVGKAHTPKVYTNTNLSPSQAVCVKTHEFDVSVTSPNGKVAVCDDIVGYWINRRFMFMGQWLKHAYYPNWNLRFFRHKLGRYEKLTDQDTASGDNEVHEHVIVRGKTAHLQAEMDHYAFPSVDVFIEKHNRYSNWEARVARARKVGSSAASIQSGRVGLRRRLKGLSHRLPCRPFLRFCYIYFWQRGFLDGKAGYYFAQLHAVYEFLCVAKETELARQKTPDQRQ